MLPETCEQAMERLERDKTAAYLTLDGDTVDATVSADDAMAVVGAIFRHPERVEIRRLGFTDMSPELPGALVEREVYCDECGTCTTAWREVETERFSCYKLCADCQGLYADTIADMEARNRMRELEAGEDA